MTTNLIFYAPITFFVAYLGYCAIETSRQYFRDTALGRRFGCSLPPELTKKWPLGIDRIKDLWETNSQGRLLAYLCSVAEQYEPGNNLTQYLLFGPRAFHVLHPANVETLLSTNFKHYGFGARPAIFAPLLGNGIFTQEGLAWKHSRELLRKQFVRIQYQNLDLFREHVDNFLACLPTDGIVDLQPLFFNLTLDTTTHLLFGRSVYSLRADIDQEMDNKIFSESFNIAQEGLAKRFRIAPFHFLYNTAEFRKACANVHQFVEQYIEQLDLQKSEGDSSYTFIRQVAQESATKKDLRDQLLNVLLAGRDSTACCLSWTLRLLVRHPHMMDRLRNEIASVMDGSTHPTRQHVRKMAYLDCVVKESLRLYPPVPLNNREAIQTTILPIGGGPDGQSPMLVRKGELVVFSQYVNSRIKNIYGPDAYEFNPERWEGRKLSDIGWAYFPFNGGPRQCLGQDFALMEISYTIIRLLQSFLVITLPDSEPVEPLGSEKQRLTLVLSSADGCRIFGIKELYHPVDQQVVVDIVAVHGLNGHATKTWTSQGICWLNHPEFLPKFVKNARVLTWGYNANISTLYGKHAGSDRILQHSQTLIADLDTDRDLEDATDRPIIFICHSLGGLIVKRAIAYAASRVGDKLTNIHSIFTCTFGILFFGTPHLGSDRAQLAGSLQKLASLAFLKQVVDFESGLLKALEAESETLQNINDQFAPLLTNFCIYFFWEKQKTDVKFTREFIVEETSAAPILDNIESRVSDSKGKKAQDVVDLLKTIEGSESTLPAPLRKQLSNFIEAPSSILMPCSPKVMMEPLRAIGVSGTTPLHRIQQEMVDSSRAIEGPDPVPTCSQPEAATVGQSRATEGLSRESINSQPGPAMVGQSRAIGSPEIVPFPQPGDIDPSKTIESSVAPQPLRQDILEETIEVPRSDSPHEDLIDLARLIEHSEGLASSYAPKDWPFFPFVFLFMFLKRLLLFSLV
ncbi:hypothetical protein FQN57_000515 [Myotisia sp. PD_48]|nr:hypothetical protein FQN57_000515 [Myotisia sp. PD_48]